MTGQFDGAINRALDEYELMRRKAAAWDAALALADDAGAVGLTRYDLDELFASVHPAQDASSS